MKLLSKRKKTVAAASIGGPGNRSPASLPKAQAAAGMSTTPLTTTSLKATA